MMAGILSLFHKNGQQKFVPKPHTHTQKSHTAIHIFIQDLQRVVGAESVVSGMQAGAQPDGLTHRDTSGCRVD